MGLKDEIKGLIKVDIDEKEVADRIFDKAVDPLMLKLVDLIPTDIDNAFYAGKKAELKALFAELVGAEVQKVEDKIDEVLDEKPAE